MLHPLQLSFYAIFGLLHLFDITLEFLYELLQLVIFVCHSRNCLFLLLSELLEVEKLVNAFFTLERIVNKWTLAKRSHARLESVVLLS